METVLNEESGQTRITGARPMKVLFAAKDSDFKIVLFKTDDTKLSFKASGTGLPTKPNVTASLVGKWTENKYGRQFAVQAAEAYAPKSGWQLKRYLEELELPYLTAIRAARLASKGAECYRILEDPKRVEDFFGIPQDQAKKMSDGFLEKKDMDRLFRVLEEFELPLGIAGEIKKRGEREIKLTRKQTLAMEIYKNPYLLCSLGAASFSHVDRIMKRRPDFYPLSETRVRQGLLAAFTLAETQGHCFTTPDEILKYADKTFGGDVPKDKCTAGINMLVKTGFARFDHGGVYLKRTYEAETQSAEILAGMLKKEKEADREHIKGLEESAEKELGVSLDKDQKEAVINASVYPVSIITGGPGRGKTTVIKVLIETYLKANGNAKIRLCAPTGKAARRMTESCGREASTIHSALKMRPGCERQETEPEKLEDDLVIIDESSMCDMFIFHALLKSLKEGAGLVLIGDKDQLPSVGCGNVYAELIACKKVPTTVLKTVYRQSNGSSIIDNADRVNENRMPVKPGNGTELIQAVKEEDCLKYTLWAVKKAIRKYGADNVQVLSPYRRNTKVGTRELNPVLQKVFNPQRKDFAQFGKRTFYKGDRVINLANNAQYELSNGDIGVVTDAKDGEITVVFDNEAETRRTYKRGQTGDIDLAYALTIHKSQGSEYACVIIPFIELFGSMLQKNLLYTAITRASKEVIIVGNDKSVRIAAANKKQAARNTYLAWRVKTLCEKL